MVSHPIPHPAVSGEQLRVFPVPGEPTVYHVESSSAQCSSCSRVYKRWKWAFCPDTGGHRRVPRKGVTIEGPCPYRFGCDGKLQLRFHKVDIAAYNGNGQCGCETFEFSFGPALSKVRPSLWLESGLRCRHIQAARQYALDLTILNHTKQQLAPYANGRKERDGTW